MTTHHIKVTRHLNFVFSGCLKEDLADLKEQINLYENAVKYGVIGLDQSDQLENHLSESWMDLGLKKANKKNGLHRYVMSHYYLLTFVESVSPSVIFLTSRPSKKALSHCVGQRGRGSAV